MRLVSLTANIESFHAVHFRQTGPSLVVGRQSSKSAEGGTDTHTYNGVGKSLLLYLINYCLGAEPKDSFTSQLNDWEFTLRVAINNHEMPIVRKVSAPDIIRLGFEELSLEDFRKRLQEYIFPGTEDIKFLTLRSLLGSFLRPGKMAYSKWDGIHHSEKPVQRQIRASYLLGLNVDLVTQKFELIEELRSMRDMSTRFSKDPIIKEYFNGKKDVSLDIRELEDQLAILDRSLSEFKVAENYHDVEQEAQELKASLQKLRNTALATGANLRQIEESLKVQPDISLESVRQIYEEAKVHFSIDLLRRLSEVENFHAELLEARRTRLKKEKEAHEQRLASTEARIKSLNEQLDGKLRFLNDHGALGELLSLKDRSNELRNRLQKLLDYKTLTKKFKDRSAELQVDLATASVETARYLDANEPSVAAINETFRSFTKLIYPEKQSGLSVENDEGENQTRFKIDAKIISDASDGINEAKIFSYDLTVATLRRNHDVRFICHDSRLYSDIDPRQRAEIFRLAASVSVEHDFQYIATVNQDQIEAVRGILGEAEFGRIISQNTVLELKDDSPADRLLGIEVDIDYD